MLISYWYTNLAKLCPAKSIKMLSTPRKGESCQNSKTSLRKKINSQL